MTAISLRSDTWIDSEPPAPKPPSKNALRKARIRALQTEGADPDGDILAMEMIGPTYSGYRSRLWSRNPTCCYCGCKIKKEGDASLDHLVPRARGGLNSPSNLVLSCETCNRLKGDKHILEWFDIIRGLCIAAGLIEAPDEPEEDEPEDRADWWKDRASSG